MKETRIIALATIVGLGSLLVWGNLSTRTLADDTAKTQVATEDKKPEETYKPRTKTQLRRLLTPIQYDVTQNEATERAFQNKYWNNKKEGTYFCIVCDKPLFQSDTKYKSGTGWPSFWAPVDQKNVGLRKDSKLFYTRVEVHCKRCGAHLGHVFDDGPKPTGKRYCMNSASLKFLTKAVVEKKEQESANRDGKSPNAGDSPEKP